MMMTKQDYLGKRAGAQQSYFSQKAANNKKNYYIASMVKLGISFLITVVSAFESGNSPTALIVAALSAFIAFTEGVLLLCKYNENWVIYRITSENIKREEVLFESQAGEYYGLDESCAFNLFVQNIESIIQCSNKQWESIYNNRKEK